MNELGAKHGFLVRKGADDATANSPARRCGRAYISFRRCKQRRTAIRCAGIWRTRPGRGSCLVPRLRYTTPTGMCWATKARSGATTAESCYLVIAMEGDLTFLQFRPAHLRRHSRDASQINDMPKKEREQKKRPQEICIYGISSGTAKDKKQHMFNRQFKNLLFSCDSEGESTRDIELLIRDRTAWKPFLEGVTGGYICPSLPIQLSLPTGCPMGCFWSV